MWRECDPKAVDRAEVQELSCLPKWIPPTGREAMMNEAHRELTHRHLVGMTDAESATLHELPRRDRRTLLVGRA